MATTKKKITARKKTAARKQATTPKKATPRRAKASRRATRKGARETGHPLQDGWAAAVEAVHSAQEEAERQIRVFLKEQKIGGKDAATVLKNLRKRFEQKRKTLLRDLETEMTGLQARLKRERKALGKSVDDAVRGTLAAFNIPSRQEVVELTHKVDQLSKKIDAFSGRRAKRRG